MKPKHTLIAISISLILIACGEKEDAQSSNTTTIAPQQAIGASNSNQTTPPNVSKPSKTTTPTIATPPAKQAVVVEPAKQAVVVEPAKQDQSKSQQPTEYKPTKVKPDYSHLSPAERALRELDDEISAMK